MRWAVALPVMMIITILQVEIFDSALIGGRIRIDLPLYLLVAIGLSTRSTEAATAGFVLGVVVDLFQFGPFGIQALMYCLAGWTLAEARIRVLQDGSGARTMQGILWTLVVTSLTWLLGAVFGQKPLALNFGPWGVLLNLVAAGALGGLAVHLMSRLVRLIVKEEWDSRANAMVTL